MVWCVKNIEAGLAMEYTWGVAGAGELRGKAKLDKTYHYMDFLEILIQKKT